MHRLPWDFSVSVQNLYWIRTDIYTPYRDISVLIHFYYDVYRPLIVESIYISDTLSILVLTTGEYPRLQFSCVIPLISKLHRCVCTSYFCTNNPRKYMSIRRLDVHLDCDRIPLLRRTIFPQQTVT
jgi:hypothetical protein